MRSTPKLSLNLSFQPPLAIPSPPLSSSTKPTLTLSLLPSSTYTPPARLPSTLPQPPSTIPSSPTTLNTQQNKTLTLSSYSPPSEIQITTLTYTPPPPYTLPSNSPKSILKRRNPSSPASAISISTAGVESPPASGRSISFNEELQVRCITPISPSGDGPPSWGGCGLHSNSSSGGGGYDNLDHHPSETGGSSASGSGVIMGRGYVKRRREDRWNVAYDPDEC